MAKIKIFKNYILIFAFGYINIKRKGCGEMNVNRFPVEENIKNLVADASIKTVEGNHAMHCHEFYELEIILSGEGTYVIDGCDYKIERGALYIMSPVSFHKLNINKNVKLINLMFTSEAASYDFLTRIFANVPCYHCVLSEEDLTFIEVVATELSKLLENNKVYDEYAGLLINSVLGKVCRLMGKLPQNNEVGPMKRAVFYIESHFTEHITLEDAAKIAGYARNYFSTVFKSYTGKSFKTYLNDLRFDFAKKLLMHTDMTISEIALKCGFGDFSHFMADFKKRFNTTPKKLREQLKKELLGDFS